jgi:uncharacterized membrane protein YGL010W
MATLETWFERYAVSHRHPTNRALHAVCVPLIALSLLYLLDDLPAGSIATVRLHWGGIAGAAAIAWYATLSLRHAAGILAIAGLVGYGLQNHPALTSAPVMATVFGLAWVGQFVGHQIEGRRPSFVDDLRFLLVGPVWVLDGLYRRLGGRHAQ